MGAPPCVGPFFVISTYRITGLHYIWVLDFKCSLRWLALPSESMGYTSNMGVKPSVQQMSVRSSYWITLLQYSYGCTNLSEASLCNLYLQNHFVTLVLWEGLLHCSQCWLRLPTESLACTTHMGVQRKVQPKLVVFTFRINGLHLTYGCPTLIGACDY